MLAQSIVKTLNESRSDSRSYESEIAHVLRHDIAAIQKIILTLARILFSVVLLSSIVNWNDNHWMVFHGLALIPLSWAVLAAILTLFGQFRWTTGGRIMVVVDMIVSAAVIVVFPAYTLSALALAVLSMTFMVLRHSGGFGTLLLILPLAAMMVRPLGILNIPGIEWVVSYATVGIAGEIVAFLLSSFATLFSILMFIHIRMVERPLTFQQPWEEKFTLEVDEHNIAPVIDYIGRLYPGSKFICILDDPKRRKGKSIISNSSISRSVIEPLRSQLTDYADEGCRPVIVELDNRVQIDVDSGQQSQISTSFEKMARGLTELGFDNGVLFDFKLDTGRGRLFFSTGTIIEEPLRQDMISLSLQLHRYFRYATKWEERRKEMIAFARDLARRDLHDGILQSLAALKIRLLTIISRPDFPSSPDIEALRKTVDFITLEQTRLRALLHNDEGDDDIVNLVEAIEVCLKTLSLQWEVSIKLASHEPALSVDHESAENIEYLVREAIANSIRHAGAKNLTLGLNLTKGNLVITLKDDLIASANAVDSRQAAQKILESRSLSQRLKIVNGHAYTQDLEDSTLLVISIPMDFTEND